MTKKILSVLISLLILIVFLNGRGEMDNTSFESKRIIKSASITLNGAIGDVLPLFGAREEQKWAPDWKPEFIYPRDKKDEKNNVFKIEHTAGDGHHSIVYYWVMTEFSAELNKVSYAIFSSHDITTISIQCNAVSDSSTTAVVEYVWTSLDDHGDKLIERKSERIFSKNLTDWEDAINQYLQQSTG
ncbi:MAG: hypothetical protein JSU74_12500 [Candidatus Zixiibacteriota bacterium]|nr:MAG: hypothetical protein JSU74_12500 [candidate division Zixibacteria bacterium]